MEMTVKLQVFEGPLDLLLHLLEKNKVNIYDIPIVEITNQYMEYIAEMKRQDLNVVSEFLVMAATLIDIKSRMLLPAPETEDEEEEVEIKKLAIPRRSAAQLANKARKAGDTPDIVRDSITKVTLFDYSDIIAGEDDEEEDNE